MVSIKEQSWLLFEPKSLHNELPHYFSSTSVLVARKLFNEIYDLFWHPNSDARVMSGWRPTSALFRR
jgi:hypothetical protein